MLPPRCIDLEINVQKENIIVDFCSAFIPVTKFNHLRTSDSISPSGEQLKVDPDCPLPFSRFGDVNTQPMISFDFRAGLAAWRAL